MNAATPTTTARRGCRSIVRRRSRHTQHADLPARPDDGVPRRPRDGTRPQPRDGMVLVVVLVAIVIVSLAAGTFAELMFAEHEAAVAAGRSRQARVLADSGLESVRRFLGETRAARYDLGGVYDNAALFRGPLVIDDPLADFRGRFSVVAPLMQGGLPTGGLRFGLEDESTRLNLNVLTTAENVAESGGRDLLMGLPGMTPDVADAILDWMDADDDLREFGSEIETYDPLGYSPANGPLTTVEELLQVRGVTPQLLFGADTNRNGVIDGDETPMAAVDGVDNSDGSMDRGWAAYLTLHSAEANLRPDGQAKIDLNQEDMQALYTELSGVFPTEWANFIVAYRQYGATRSGRGGGGEGSQGGGRGGDGDQGGGGQGGGGRGGGGQGGGGQGGGGSQQNNVVTADRIQLDLTVEPRANIAMVIDLIGAQVQVEIEGTDERVTVRSPFSDQPGEMAGYLPQLLDHAAANAQPTIPGRVNINQAPRAVLLGIPGLEDDQVEAILSSRDEQPPDPESPRRHETWIMAEGIVTLEEMKQLSPFVCAGGDIFRAQVAGYYDRGGPSARIEAVIDASQGAPRILMWRDLSHLGLGYTPAAIGAVTQ